MISKRRTIMASVLVDVEQEDDGSWHGSIEGFKGLHSAGAYEAEAIRNTVNAATAYLISCQRRGDPIPVSIFFKPSLYAEWPDW